MLHQTGIDGVALVLMKHQEEGVDFLTSRRVGLLAFEQGLGKTLVAIESFRRVRKQKQADVLVVVSPNSLKRNWEEEIRKFAPELAVTVVEGDRRRRRHLLARAMSPVVVMSYETCRAEMMSVRALLIRHRAALVFDESHNIKNRESLSTIAADNLAIHASYRWLLSGTPVTNSPADLFSQINMLGGEAAFPSFSAFDSAYGDANDTGQRNALASRVAPYLMRRTKRDCLALPVKSFQDIHVELPSWQRKLYDAVRDQLLSEIESLSSENFRAFVPTALTRILRLSQISSNPALVFPSERRVSGKIQEVDHLVEEILADRRHKLIIWSYYVDTIKVLTARYTRFGARALYGGTPLAQRQDVAKSFQQEESFRILVANPAAAGSGFTLTAATYAIYETLSWRYDHYAQSQDRIHRIGQHQPVTYLRLLAVDTVDHAIADSLRRKSLLAAGLLQDDKDMSVIEGFSRDAFAAIVRTGRLPPD